MIDYIKENALYQAARKCREEMLKTKDLGVRRTIADAHLAPLRLKFGINKPELLYAIYQITKES
jgi:hypothetical protein